MAFWGTEMNSKARYYTPPGSYDGLVKIDGRWVRASGLNRISKVNWVRWQGPPSIHMERALRRSFSFIATALFPKSRLVPPSLKGVSV